MLRATKVVFRGLGRIGVKFLVGLAKVTCGARATRAPTAKTKAMIATSMCDECPIAIIPRQLFQCIAWEHGATLMQRPALRRCSSDRGYMDPLGSKLLLEYDWPRIQQSSISSSSLKRYGASNVTLPKSESAMRFSMSDGPSGLEKDCRHLPVCRQIEIGGHIWPRFRVQTSICRKQCLQYFHGNSKSL